VITVRTKPNDERTLGGKLRSTRQKMRYTTEQAAELLDISVVYLNAIERNARRPSLELLIEMCLSYGVSSDYLLFDSSYGYPSSNPPDGNCCQYSLPHKLNDEQLETVMHIAAIISCKNFAKHYLDFLSSQFIQSADFISKRQNIIKENTNEQTRD